MKFELLCWIIQISFVCALQSSMLTNTSNKLTARVFMSNMAHVQKEFNVHVFYFEQVSSTMNKAKELVKSVAVKDNVFAVLAERQYQGRGTRGREWVSSTKNMFLTVVIKQSLIPVPLNYVPLRIGTIVGDAVRSRVTSGAEVQLKWPNDILIDDKKVCGILIEIEDGNVVVGIGCNVRTAPNVTPLGQHGGRPSTCLAEHNEEMRLALTAEQSLQSLQSEQADVLENNVDIPSPEDAAASLSPTDFHKELAMAVCGGVSAWVEAQSDSADQVLRDFERHMDRAPQTLRDNNNHAVATGEQVTPLGLNSDGSLQVRSETSGTVKTLVADYLW